MNIKIKIPEVTRPKMTVIGIGGAGGNAVNNMLTSKLQGPEFVVANTDSQALEYALCENRIQLGLKTTGGLGAGADPEIGRNAAEESLEEIKEYIKSSNMVFITAGMGGGTGTGAAPVIARASKELGILTVAVVTKPFLFEGAHRMRTAEKGLEELQKHVDTLIVIPNQNLFRIANEKTTFTEAFKLADEVLHNGVRSITDLIIMPGLVNLDFADIRSVIKAMGKAMMGTGEASGEDRAEKAAVIAMSNPLLDHNSIKGAKAVLINITGGMDMTLFEVDAAANKIRNEVGETDANIIFGSTFNSNLDGIMRVSVIATGIDAEHYQKSILTDVPETQVAGSNQEDEVLDNASFEEAEPVKFDEYDLAKEQEENASQTQEAIEETTGPNRTRVYKSNYSFFSWVASSLWNKDEAQNSKKEPEPELEPVAGTTSENIYDIPAFLRRNKDNK